MKINIKRTKSLMPGIIEDEEVTLGYERLIRWAASIALVVLLVKTVGAVPNILLSRAIMKERLRWLGHAL